MNSNGTIKFSEINKQAPLQKWIQIALAVVVVLYAAYLINSLSKNTADFQWDFKSYYYATTAHSLDNNPYEVASLTEVAGHEVLFGFYYNPILLWFFKPFTLFSLDTALQIWLFLKVFFIAFTIYIWRRYFVPDIPLGIFALFVLMAFDATIFWDFKTGNITIFEQVILWSGLFAFLRGRLILFSLLIILASLIKVSPLFFLILIPLSDIRGKWWYTLGAFLATVVIYLCIYLTNPELFQSFVTLMRGLYESAQFYNYSTLSIIDYFQKSATAIPLGESPAEMTYAIYAVVVLAFVFITLWVMHVRNRLIPAIDRKLLIIIACILYAIILPRFKCYSYIILIIPSLFMIREYFASRANPYLIFLFLLPVAFPMPSEHIYQFLSTLYPLYLAYFVWVLCIIKLKTMRDVEKLSQVVSENSMGKAI